MKLPHGREFLRLIRTKCSVFSVVTVTYVFGMDPDNLARPERFELPTPWFVARYSIQLSYGRAARNRMVDQGLTLRH
jgi:hypothetical protein